jgi:hypothetical protein
LCIAFGLGTIPVESIERGPRYSSTM